MFVLWMNEWTDLDGFCAGLAYVLLLAAGYIHPFRPSSLLRGLQFPEFASKSRAHGSQTGIDAPLASILPCLPRFHRARQISLSIRKLSSNCRQLGTGLATVENL